MRIAACVEHCRPHCLRLSLEGRSSTKTKTAVYQNDGRRRRATGTGLLQELHPYELLECVELAIDGWSEAYPAWLASEARRVRLDRPPYCVDQRSFNETISVQRTFRLCSSRWLLECRGNDTSWFSAT